MGEPRVCSWVRMSGGVKPNYGVHAGVDSGNEVYVARANHEGAVVPGKLHVSHTSAYIPYDGKELPKSTHEVLLAPLAALSWVRASGSSIPVDAVIGGHAANGETYYIGRVIHNGTVTVGKVHPSHGACYVAYGGKELNFQTYEILVRNLLGLHLGA